jgi:hypothetical protein
MGSLDERLAEARNAPRSKDAPDYFEIGFDVAAAIAREVVAEKDAEIVRLEAVVDACLDGTCSRRETSGVYAERVAIIESPADAGWTLNMGTDTTTSGHIADAEAAT